MKTALFTNFSSEEFICAWDGKVRKFIPGQSIYLPDYLAHHFAKHLTNRELIKTGKERSTSPKFPDQEPHFMELFNKAYTPDESNEFGENNEEKKDDLDTLINVTNKNRETKSAVAGPQDPNEPQMIHSPDDDEDVDEESFENKPLDN